LLPRPMRHWPESALKNLTWNMRTKCSVLLILLGFEGKIWGASRRLYHLVEVQGRPFSWQ